ncbi:hypothetical protein ZWY2020_060055 [Hordeum vulgare]|nr:hypothetical protein ZWY2020_060055 [Hordeum vulgare]
MDCLASPRPRPQQQPPLHPSSCTTASARSHVGSLARFYLPSSCAGPPALLHFAGLNLSSTACAGRLTPFGLVAPPHQRLAPPPSCEQPSTPAFAQLTPRPGEQFLIWIKRVKERSRRQVIECSMTFLGGWIGCTWDQQ